MSNNIRLRVLQSCWINKKERKSHLDNQKAKVVNFTSHLLLSSLHIKLLLQLTLHSPNPKNHFHRRKGKSQFDHFLSKNSHLHPCEANHQHHQSQAAACVAVLSSLTSYLRPSPLDLLGGLRRDSSGLVWRNP